MKDDFEFLDMDIYDSIESGVPKREKRTPKTGVKRKPAKASTSRKRAPSGHKSKTPHPSRTRAAVGTSSSTGFTGLVPLIM